MSRSAKVNQVILIILDDVRGEHLFKWMNEEKLPNISQLANNGISCQNTVTSFPSVTLPCYADIITGSNSGFFPEEGSGVPNYHWINRMDPPLERKKSPFIRNYSERRDVLKINKDIGKHVKTIFEQAGDGNFLSATSFLYRGSTFTTSKEFRKAEMILKRIEDIYKKPNELFPNKEVPRVSVGYIPHTDELMHEKGFDHPDYVNLVFRCDKFIGSLIKTLKDTGYYENTAIAITSDHGNYRAPNFFDLEPFFKKKGLKPYNQANGSGNFDANLGGVGFFNFKGDSWFHHPTVNQMKEYNTNGSKKMNLFEILWDIPGVELMYYKDENSRSDKGVIHLERRDKFTKKISTGRIEYSDNGRYQKTKYIFDDEDVFGYKNNEKASSLLDNKAHTIDEWIPATVDTDFINIVDQLPRHFKNPRSCDIMVSSMGLYNYNYEHGHTKGISPFSHDVANRKSMLVPLVIGGSPEIPRLELSCSKTTHIDPT